MTAGGKRKGAGRPPLHAEDRPQAVTVRIHPQLVRRLADWCAARGLSQAEAFAGWVRRLRAAPDHPGAELLLPPNDQGEERRCENLKP